MTIGPFEGDYEFLSNFYPSRIEYGPNVYPTVEHFFQAMKTVDQYDRRLISEAPKPGVAKRMGRKVTLRTDWELCDPNLEPQMPTKERVMLLGLRRKFADPELAAKLLATGDEDLVEINHWHDNYWGICLCNRCEVVGHNRLGILLMQVREEIK